MGPFDDWSADPALSRVTRDELDALLEPFAVEMCEEVHREGRTAKGHTKTWHLYEIVARKR